MDAKEEAQEVNRRIDIKFNKGYGRSCPLLKDFLVHEQMNKWMNPTGYAWFFFKCRDAEWNAMYERLCKNSGAFQIIGIEIVKNDER